MQTQEPAPTPDLTHLAVLVQTEGRGREGLKSAREEIKSDAICFRRG